MVGTTIETKSIVKSGVKSGIMSELKLSKNDTLLLIDSYRKKECLWNMSSTIYKRQDLKRKAWEALAGEFKTSTDIIKKKMKFLRTAYNAEQKKVQKSKSTGSSGDVYQPILFYFKELNFISESASVRDSFENIPKGYITNTTNECEECSRDESSRDEASASFSSDVELPVIVEEETLMEIPQRQQKRQKTRRNNNIFESQVAVKYDKAVAAIIESLKPTAPEDENVYITFGKSVGMQLKQLSEMEAANTMCEIQGILSRKVREMLQAKLSGNICSTSSSSSAGGNRHTSTPITKIPAHCVIQSTSSESFLSTSSGSHDAGAMIDAEIEEIEVFNENETIYI